MDEIMEIAEKLAEQVGDGSMGLPKGLWEAVVAMPKAEQEESMLKVEAGGRGSRGCRLL